MNTSSPIETERATQGAAGNLADFFRDLASLFELQGLLFLADAADEFRKARKGLLLIALSTVLGASCLPLGLAGVALVLAEETRLSVGQALLCVAAVFLTVACAGVYAAARWANPGATWMQRSRAECRLNLTWIKDTLKHIDNGRHDSSNSRTGASL